MRRTVAGRERAGPGARPGTAGAAIRPRPDRGARAPAPRRGKDRRRRTRAAEEARPRDPSISRLLAPPQFHEECDRVHDLQTRSTISQTVAIGPRRRSKIEDIAIPAHKVTRSRGNRKIDVRLVLKSRSYVNTRGTFGIRTALFSSTARNRST